MNKSIISLLLIGKPGYQNYRHPWHRFSALLLISLCTISFHAYAAKDEAILPAKTYYDLASQFMDKKQYQSALEQFALIRAWHPLSPYVQVAELESISAHYGLGDYEEAEYKAQRFIGFYTDSRQQDFAYYMAARSQYARGIVLTDRFDKRDLSGAKEAYATFNQLVSLFPNSQYVPESYAHMRHIRNILAEDELKLAQFYFKRFSYVVAINRCQNILENFPGSPYSLQALKLMERSYRKLGWDDQAKIVASVYKENIGLKAN